MDILLRLDLGRKKFAPLALARREKAKKQARANSLLACSLFCDRRARKVLLHYS
jgi:hypothetical protein